MHICSGYLLAFFKVVDIGAEFLHRSLIWLVLAGGGVVAGVFVEHAQKSDGIYGAEVIGQDGDTLTVEVDGIGVICGSAHGISDGGKKGVR